MADLKLKHLTLTGFGCYRDKISIKFNDGINTLIAPNESGKSTLIAGLEAIIFGLPKSRNAQVYGKARFINWEEPPLFEGEVKFQVNDQVYRLWRCFHNNKVSFKINNGGNWEELWHGQHNPNAHRKIPVYDRYLKKLIGITSRKVFEDTFFLAQPLPEGDQIGQEVQKLLSGSGGHYQDALTELSNSLRSLTRFTGDFGVGNNGRKDAKLENLKLELDSLRNKQEVTCYTIDQLTMIKDKVKKLSEEIRDTRIELKKQQNLKSAWDYWRSLQTRYDSVLREQRQAKDIWDKARKIQLKLSQLEEEVRNSYPEWLHTQKDVAEELYNLMEIENSINSLKKELIQFNEKLEQLKHEQENINDKLQNDYRHLVNRPNLLHNLEKLKALLTKKKELFSKIEELNSKIEEYRSQLSSVSDFGIFGQSPVTALKGIRVTVNQMLDNWERFWRQQVRLQELEEAIYGELSCFLNLPPNIEAMLTDYKSNLKRLERDKQLAEESYRIIIEKQKLYKQLEDELRQYKDIEPLSKEVIEATVEKPRVLQELKIKEDSQRSILSDNIKRRRLIVTLFSGIGLVTGMIFGNWFFALLGLFLGIIGGSLSSYLTNKNGKYVTLVKEISDLKGHIQKYDELLGPWANATVSQLNELSRRLQERDKLKKDLEAMAKDLPSEFFMETSRQNFSNAKKVYEDFLKVTTKISASFSDVTSAYRKFQNFLHERDVLANTIQSFAKSIAGVKPEELMDIPVTTLEMEPWQDLIELAKLNGQEVGTLGELLEWLRGLKKEDWDNFLNKASSWEELTSFYQKTLDRKSEVLGYDANGETELDRLDKEIEDLERKVAPFSVDDEVDKITSQLEIVDEMKNRLRELDGLIQATSTHTEELKKRINQLNSSKEQLQQKLKPLLKGSKDTKSAIERLKCYQKIVQEQQNLRGQLEGLLGEGDVVSLEFSYLDAANRAGAILKEWQTLVKNHPGLPSPGIDKKTFELEEYYKNLNETIDNLQNRLQELEKEEQNYLRQQALLEGKQVINVARVSEMIEIKEKELERLELEASALALAYHELLKAAKEYSQNYRQELALTVTRYFNLFTGFDNRKVTISEDFQVIIYEDGKNLSIDQLSRGTQDQLYIALRLGIGDLLSGNLSLPFIFDDTFINCDYKRRERIKEILQSIATRRQIILLSHDSFFSTWGKSVEFC